MANAFMMPSGGGKEQGPYAAAVSVAGGSGQLYARIPRGGYMKVSGSGYPEVVIPNRSAISALSVVPVYAFSCTGGRQAAPYANTSYVSTSGSQFGPQWTGSYGRVTVLKDGYYTVAAAHFREVSSAPYFTFAGTDYYETAVAGGWLTAGSVIEIRITNQISDGYFWCYGIGISYVG